jgi:hydrogenase nickel incorporation protein HypA/HybF
MHETDMTKALIMTVRDWYDSQPEKLKIEKIHLMVGEFTCVEPVSLQFAFEVQTANTFLAGVELAIKDYQPQIGQQYSCPTCRSPMEDIRSGRELKIDHIEYSLVS